jgi:hypothetical protein
MDRAIDVNIGETVTIDLDEGRLTVGRDGSLWFFSLLPHAASGDPPVLTYSATVAAKARSGRLRLRYRLPAMPVMFRFPEPIAMIPDSSVLLGFPLALDLCLEASDGAALWRVASRSLASAWYGDLDSGEECHAVQTLPLPIANELEAPGGPWAAGFPVRLRNETKRRIEIPRVSAPTSRLRLYESAGRYLADPVELSYEPDDDIKVSCLDLRALRPDAGLTLSDQPRETQADFLVKKGMRLLRGLAGWEAR